MNQTWVPGLLIVAALAGRVHAGTDLCAAPSAGADMVVVRITDGFKWGTVGDLTAYSFGTELLNIGDATLVFDAQAASHPVMVQNLYRLEAGRLEQIGMSWVKHTFRAVPQGPDCVCIDPMSDQVLGVGCTDPYTASTNGAQAGFNGGTVGGMGPRSEVNPATGVFPWPFATRGQAGDAVYKRLQVLTADVDPARRPTARFFVDSHYVSAEEPGGNRLNNASYREVLVGERADGGFDLQPTGPTVIQPAIHAWQAADSDVAIHTVEVPDDGTLMLATLVSENDDGTWHYEYVLYNMTSDRAVAAFDVPVDPAVTVTGIGFHDVDHHSGEGFDGTAWPGQVVAGGVRWAAENAADDPGANALRWGTAYTFRFDADAPPAPAALTIGLFRTGAPAAVTVTACAPDPAAGADSACSQGNADDDGDGVADAGDVCPQTQAGAAVDAMGCSAAQRADRQPPAASCGAAGCGPTGVMTLVLLALMQCGRHGRRLRAAPCRRSRVR